MQSSTIEDIDTHPIQLDRHEDLLREISRLRDSLSQVKGELEKSELRNAKNEDILAVYNQKLAEINLSMDHSNSQKKSYMDALRKYLIKLQNHQRSEHRKWCNEQGIRLGRIRMGISSSGHPGRPAEIWEEGEEFVKLNQQLKEIQAEKAEIEKLKRSKKGYSRSNNFSFAQLNSSRSSLAVFPELLGGLCDSRQLEGEDSEQEIDKAEQKEIY